MNTQHVILHWHSYSDGKEKRKTITMHNDDVSVISLSRTVILKKLKFGTLVKLNVMGCLVICCKGYISINVLKVNFKKWLPWLLIT